jgi:predicted branched-subunit amino acid permease
MGLSTQQAVVMSALVFSGTAQMAVVSVWPTLGGIGPAFLIVLVANIRYLFMSASLRPWLETAPSSHRALPLALLVDSSFAVGMRAHDEGQRDIGWLLGPALASWSGWVTGTGLGFTFGQIAGDPRQLGLDFVVVGFCIVAVVAMARTTREFRPAIAGLLAAMAADRLASPTWSVVAAAAAAALMAAWLYAPPPLPPREAAS